MRQGIAALLMLSLSACGGHYDDGTPQQVVKDASGAALTFGRIEKVAGTQFVTLPVIRDDGGSSSLGKSYEASEERNRLIVDSSTGASRRVLPDNKFQIVNWIVPKTRPADPSDPANDLIEGSSGLPADIYAAVVKHPGAKDKDPATYDVLFGHFGSRQQVWIGRGLSGVQSIWLTPDHKLAMVAAANNHGLFRLYDPVTFRQLLEKELAL